MLSLVTLNTWKCDGRYGARLKLMAAQLATLQPDVLFLQEAFAAPEAGLDTAARMAEALGHEYAVAPARAKPRTLDARRLDSTSSPALLTRGTIETSRSLALPSDPADGERIAQVAEIAIDGLRLLCVNMHLTYLPDGDAMRRDEIETTLAALPDPAPFDAVIMAGDFNCPPDSAPIRWLMAESGWRVTDPCRTAGVEFITHVSQKDLGRPDVRIDYLFQLERPGAPSRFALTGIERVLDAPDADLGITPSDHFGVRAVLAERNPSQT